MKQGAKSVMEKKTSFFSLFSETMGKGEMEPYKTYNVQQEMK